MLTNKIAPNPSDLLNAKNSFLLEDRLKKVNDKIVETANTIVQEICEKNDQTFSFDGMSLKPVLNFQKFVARPRFPDLKEALRELNPRARVLFDKVTAQAERFFNQRVNFENIKNYLTFNNRKKIVKNLIDEAAFPHVQNLVSYFDKTDPSIIDGINQGGLRRIENLGAVGV